MTTSVVSTPVVAPVVVAKTDSRKNVEECFYMDDSTAKGTLLVLQGQQIEVLEKRSARGINGFVTLKVRNLVTEEHMEWTLASDGARLEGLGLMTESRSKTPRQVRAPRGSLKNAVAAPKSDSTASKTVAAPSVDVSVLLAKIAKLESENLTLQNKILAMNKAAAASKELFQAVNPDEFVANLLGGYTPGSDWSQTVDSEDSSVS